DPDPAVPRRRRLWPLRGVRVHGLCGAQRL
ncbi:MAG: hypothetical protein AVDCRST_MAG19-1337, partial [uncultured Thermomicrobiales bacterium]